MKESLGRCLHPRRLEERKIAFVQLHLLRAGWLAQTPVEDVPAATPLNRRICLLNQVVLSLI